MLPPRTVYSLAIRNRSSRTVTLKVSYTDMDAAATHVEIRVAANDSATAPQQTYQRGSAVFAKQISSVAITSGAVAGSGASLSAPFPAVTGPTKGYPIEIVEKSGGLALETKYSE